MPQEVSSSEIMNLTKWKCKRASFLYNMEGPSRSMGGSGDLHHGKNRREYTRVQGWCLRLLLQTPLEKTNQVATC